MSACEMAEEVLITKQARIDELERELAAWRDAFEKDSARLAESIGVIQKFHNELLQYKHFVRNRVLNPGVYGMKLPYGMGDEARELLGIPKCETAKK